jgi:hypothetical protein
MAPGKRRYVDFLLESIEDPSERQVYGCGETPTRERLLESEFAGLDLGHPSIARHDREFLRLIAREYYATAAAATRAADPQHLLFGDRYLWGDHPSEVLEEAVQHVDVISVQPVGIAFDREYFDGLHEKTGKPLIICDHAMSFYTAAHPTTVWHQCPSESEAARAYDAYLRALLECPYILGYHRCQYIDRLTPDGSTLKQGLLAANERPHRMLVEQMRRTNRAVLSAFETET